MLASADAPSRERVRARSPAGRALAWLRSSDRNAWLVLVAAFAASRIAYWFAGVRFFSHGEVRSLPQLLAPDLLEHRLFQSVWYLHSQPPLFNLMVGLVLRWSPFPEGVSFQAIFVAAGLALILGLYDLGRNLGLGPATATVGAVVVGCGPTVVLWESVLNYDYLVAVLLVLVVDATARWAKGGRTGALAAVCGLAAVVVLLRSFMHPVYFFAVVALALLARRPREWRWMAVLAVGIPLVVVSGAMFKNEILFGSPELSSWLGYNLHRVAIESLTPTEIRTVEARGLLHAPPRPRACKVSHPGIPALADEYKPDHHLLNWNWDCLRRYRSQLGADAIRVARAEPGWVARSIVGSAEIWASPSTIYWEVLPNQRRIATLDRVYRTAFFGDLRWKPPMNPRPPFLALKSLTPGGHWHILVTIVLATALVLGAGLVVAVTWIKRRTASSARVALLVGSFTIAFATAVAILLEHGENNRLRFISEPLTVMLAVAVVADAVRAWRRMRSGYTG